MESIDDRRRSFLEYAAANTRGVRPGRKGASTGFFGQIARLELGLAIDMEPIERAIEYVNNRYDCSDFAVSGFLRTIYRYRDRIPFDMTSDLEDALTSFKYWWTEMGPGRMCFWTENHQIMFHSDELLAGQLYPQTRFENDGELGLAHEDHATDLIQRWMSHRARFGFSEWLSNAYFEEDLTALLNLHDFAESGEIRRYSRQLIDLLMFEISLHSFQGNLGSTHGRTYLPMVIQNAERTASTIKLVFGMGNFNDPDSTSAISLATSKYQCPEIIREIALGNEEEIQCRERHGVALRDLEIYGIDVELDKIPFFWGQGIYLHPKIAPFSRMTSETYHIRLRRPYSETIERYENEMEAHGRVTDATLKETDPTRLSPVNIESFRTPSYILSSAQDFRPGERGYQHHIWQASMEKGALVFTSHPGSDDETSRPNFWIGNGRLPRVAQHRNLLVCIHRIPEGDEHPFSHAYVPKVAFDDLREKNGWITARRGNGFLALFSQNQYEWTETGPYRNREIRAFSPMNIWICEMGTRRQWASFDQFSDAIAASRVGIRGTEVDYESPSVGRVSFGWSKGFSVCGETMKLNGYRRFENPYCQCDFGSVQYAIGDGEKTLRLDFSGLMAR